MNIIGVGTLRFIFLGITLDFRIRISPGYFMNPIGILVYDLDFPSNPEFNVRGRHDTLKAAEVEIWPGIC